MSTNTYKTGPNQTNLHPIQFLLRITNEKRRKPRENDATTEYFKYFDNERVMFYPNIHFIYALIGCRSLRR